MYFLLIRSHDLCFFLSLPRYSHLPSSRLSSPHRPYNSHGDLIFLSYKTSEAPAAPSVPSQPSAPVASTLSGQSIPIPLNPSSSSSSSIALPAGIASSIPAAPKLSALAKVVEDPVDEYWRSQDGKIMRKRDEKMCRHGEKGMCDYCMPLEVGPFRSVLFTHTHTPPSRHILQIGDSIYSRLTTNNPPPLSFGYLSHTTSPTKHLTKSNISLSTPTCVNCKPVSQPPNPLPPLFLPFPLSPTRSSLLVHRARTLPGPRVSAPNVNPAQ